MLADCLTIKKNLDLCDWVYYKLLGSASKAIYSEKNESNLLWAWLLSQSGFKIRLARSENRIHLLVSACEDICGYHYLILDGGKYYILEDDEKGSIYVFNKEFPQEKSLRLSYTGANRLENRPAGKRALKSRRYENVTVTADANLTSQLFSNIYLNELDQFCKRELGFRHYGRYVDDFYLVDNSMERLEGAIPLIGDFLRTHLHLSLNARKTRIISSRCGVPFLGAVVCPNGRFLRSRTRRHLDRRWNEALCAEQDPYVLLSVRNAREGFLKHFGGGEKKII